MADHGGPIWEARDARDLDIAAELLDELAVLRCEPEGEPFNGFAGGTCAGRAS